MFSYYVEHSNRFVLDLVLLIKPKIAISFTDIL